MNDALQTANVPKAISPTMHAVLAADAMQAGLAGLGPVLMGFGRDDGRA